ncbi:hypothetical protein [Bacillus paramycoides]|uniref:hypothetical protein n=1 Tax=Bacillus paramycoides TaxID=2026194 RepID=UPI002E222B96|nr:hypothetical protein [Bacillus paramycoides]
MVTIDDNTRIAMEVVAQTFKLSEQALLHVLKSLTNLLENKEQPPEYYMLDENTKPFGPHSLFIFFNPKIH